jgi:hypothetical protein
MEVLAQFQKFCEGTVLPTSKQWVPMKWIVCCCIFLLAISRPCILTMEPGGSRRHDSDTLTALFLIMYPILRNFKLFRLLKENPLTNQMVGYATSHPGL